MRAAHSPESETYCFGIAPKSPYAPIELPWQIDTPRSASERREVPEFRIRYVIISESIRRARISPFINPPFLEGDAPPDGWGELVDPLQQYEHGLIQPDEC